MKQIIFPLKQQMQGPTVLDLQDGLLFLLDRGLTFPRFHRHLYKEECDEIGGRNDHENQTAVHGRV